jgi:hypothetical protein
LHSVSSRATNAFEPPPCTTAQGDQLFAVALFDAALDDDEQAVRRAAARDDRLAGAEVADVERRAGRVDFARAQPIERRVGRIECLRHGPAAPRRQFAIAGRPVL